MTNTKKLIAVALSLLLLLACSSTAFAAWNGDMDDAKAVVLRELPTGSVLLSTETKANTYELRYINDTTKTRYTIEVSRDTGKITELDTRAYVTQGGAAIDLTEREAKAVVTKELPRATIQSVTLNRAAKNYTYDVAFKTDSYYGMYLINAETGAIIERSFIIEAYPGDVSQTGALTYEKARALALAKVPGAAITDIDYGRKAIGYVYEISFYKDGYEYELVLLASDGTELAYAWELEGWDDDDWYYGSDYQDYDRDWYRQYLNHWYGEWDDDWDDDWTWNGQHHGDKWQDKYNQGSYISLEKAKKVLQQKAPGGVILEIELDYDDGRATYEGELRVNNQKYDFEINAQNGQLIKWERD